ncbi:MAG: RNA methyltransferase [Fimbriiglobus sp.]
MNDEHLKRCRVVLVRTHYAGNLGSVARVMKNFGLADLVLVDPIADRTKLDAVMMATKGLPILTSARTVATMAEAVADCGWVVATSGEIGGLRRQDFWATPEEQMPALLDTLAVSPGALVFGPEPSGLTVEEISQCSAMIYIPADPEYASLNLAQSVAVCLYELRKQWAKREAPPPPAEPPASNDALERMFAQLKDSLTAQRFLWDFRSDGIFHILRQVIARGKPTVKELAVFHGLAKQLSFIAKFWGVTHPRDGRPPQAPAESPPGA